MGSHAPRVILFGTIPTSISVILVVPSKVLIVTADPLVASEDSLPPVPELPLVSPFLYSDDSKADNMSKPAKQRPERHEYLTVHDAMVSWWRDRVTSRPSSPSGSHLTILLHHHLTFPLLLLLPHLGFVDGQRFLSDSVRLSLSIDLTVPILMGCIDRHSSPDFTSDLSSSVSSLSSSSDTSSGSPSDSLSDTSSVHSSGYNISVAPEVGAVSVISPIGVLDLVDYSSSSDFDPMEDSLPLAPKLPLVSPFLCSDDSEADSESEPAE
nr:hypothetical protein [Tanacetum cinerariifolium]